jgi:zinc transport system substrate-binding protein
VGVPTLNPITRARSRLHARCLPLLSAALLAAPFPCHAAAGLETSAGGSEARPRRVFVSILPQKHFVERVGGDRVVVEVLVGPGRSPATYEPTPRQMARLAAADLLLTAGVPFETVWLPRLRRAHPGLTIRDSTAGIPRLALDAHRHDRAPAVGGKEPDGDLGDPHVWTDPRNAAAMAKQIALALADLDPAGAQQYQADAASFSQEMTTLDAELRELFAGLAGRRFLVFHPSWSYFAAA